MKILTINNKLNFLTEYNVNWSPSRNCIYKRLLICDSNQHTNHLCVILFYNVDCFIHSLINSLTRPRNIQQTIKLLYVSIVWSGGFCFSARGNIERTYLKQTIRHVYKWKCFCTAKQFYVLHTVVIVFSSTNILLKKKRICVWERITRT